MLAQTNVRFPPASYVRTVLTPILGEDDHPGVRRDPTETPAEHASRLRAGGRSGLSLDLLAADYALVRFAGVELSPREDHRAVARWRILRRRIPRDRDPRAGVEPSATIPDAD